MCGVLAIYQPGGVDRTEATAALDRMRHRGPDAQSVWIGCDGRLALGHARLKILDLSDAANQPMLSPDGQHALIFNGEIVNFRAVRAAYRGPWQFRTTSDTEVLLALLTQQGLRALHECAGMFAFALFDASQQRLTLARDRYGIKPLYWTELADGGMAFASEIAPLLRLRGRADPDLSTIRTYLEMGLYDHATATFFEGISSLPPGSSAMLDVRSGALGIERWYTLADRVANWSGATRADLVAEGRRLVATAIGDHLVADVAVGLNVSGGVDSSVLTRVAKSHVQNLHVFTQDYEAPYSERPFVERVAQGTRLHACVLTRDRIEEALDRTVRLQAEPFGGVTVVGYDQLYREANEHGITVLLDGNGVDEVFLGYEKYARLCDGSITDVVGRAIDGTPATAADAITSALRLNGELRLPASPPEFADPVRQVAALDLLATKIPRGLRFNDRMSMGRSRELRVPFLDHRLVEFGLGVPVAEHLAGGHTKSLFREIASAWVPADVAYAPKRSVQSPQREWLAGPWRGLVEDILTSSSFAGRGWVEPARARDAYRAYLEGPQENSFFIWQWVNLELWARAFLDGSAG